MSLQTAPLRLSGTLRRPPPPDAVTWLTGYLFLLLAIPSRLVFAPLGSAGAPSQVFGLLGLLWWGWFVVSRWHLEIEAFKPVRAALGVFLLAISLSYAAAMIRPIEPDEVSTADVGLIAAAAWAGAFLVANDGVPTRERLEVLLRRLAFGGGLLALVGLAQFATGQILVDAIQIPGLSANQQGSGFDRSGFLRPSGTATHPIEFGVVLTMFLPLALHLAFNAKQVGPVARWLPLSAIALIIPLSLSRSAVVGSAVAVLVLLPAWPPARRRLALIGIAAAGAAVFAVVPGIFGSVLSLFTGISDDPSALSRTSSYGLALDFVQTSPVFGRGLATFLPKYWILDNQLLLLLVTIGIVGLASFLLLIGTAIFALVKVRRQSADPYTRDVAQTLIASIATGTVGLSLFDGFAFPMTAGALFLLLGVAGALARLHREGGIAPFPTGPASLAAPDADALRLGSPTQAEGTP